MRSSNNTATAAVLVVDSESNAWIVSPAALPVLLIPNAFRTDRRATANEDERARVR